ncbi:DUF262 domain-containing protein [Ferrovibrio sp.]|uniref:GmrSD restriction endonuclease domain-containing protein n=1 Tax=Ferrovibrio sp. TaxID=1917215 RepID=UPI000CBD7E43|nr:DUF262 domain-containing protein [Ferrovibrio sp.]PJI42199.1 MAG: hypothetical protein CTR53_07105 [Ferrovibrio sp.]
MTLFTTTNYPISALIGDIDLGKIGLPELQRPFVWPNVNVRNLFDSLYRGFPAGFLLLWETGAATELRRISEDRSGVVPKIAIVDGQQRLTSLYAVIRNAEVLRADFRREKITIAFNPLSERFDVADAAIEKDKAYIPDISILWATGADLFAIADNYLTGLSVSRELTQEQKKKVQAAITRLQNLPQYNFTALTLSSGVDAATIAEVFVRINGEGKKLNQADFIMTLMSVYWDEGRAALEGFAHEATRPTNGPASSFNPFIKPSPDQLLRVTVGLALKRARLASVYSALRGRDAQTGEDDPQKREQQFDLLKRAQAHALNLANWHHFLGAIALAGYRGEKMISSEATVIYCYIFYLIGVIDYKLDKQEVRQVIAEYFFMAALTGRYTASPETRVEADLATLRSQKTGAAFIEKLREICRTTLTADYWSITVPNQLATSAARSPSLFAYLASLIVLDARVMFSRATVATLVDPLVKSTKSAIELHHLFPRGYLEDIGVTDNKKVNQIANFALVEWPDNLRIGKQAPAGYAPGLETDILPTEREPMYFWHALPPVWWTLSYDQFLIARRSKMAAVIKNAWDKLTGQQQPLDDKIHVGELIAAGESDGVEFKSTLRMNLHTGQVDDKMQVTALKTIAGFLNAKGGTLLIGVSDDGQVLGVNADNFKDEDKMGLHLVNLIKERIGDLFMPFVHPHFEEMDGQRVMVIRCERGPKPAFVKDGDKQRFFVRGANATLELSGAAMADYLKSRPD